MNVFTHAPYFKCIVFSDTILVYSKKNWRDTDVPQASIMWMCEFAQDVFYRLIPDNLHFRAILTEGRFTHSKMKNFEAFYGEALVRTYRAEGKLTGMGLYIDNKLSKFSRIFKTSTYSDKYSYVHLMQHLDTISFSQAHYPIDTDFILPAGLESFLIYDMIYLWNIFNAINEKSLNPSIRIKYVEAWRLIRNRHSGLLDTLEANIFNLRSISDFDWSPEIKRYLQGDGFFG